MLHRTSKNFSVVSFGDFRLTCLFVYGCGDFNMTQFEGLRFCFRAQCNICNICIVILHRKEQAGKNLALLFLNFVMQYLSI